ncbi:MAG: DUF4091 domain-containing protein [Tannerella sp.]|jgi:hypothetical protein|nr:DUF4091 domain-containing protein [Tannerella sp.]
MITFRFFLLLLLASSIKATTVDVWTKSSYVNVFKDFTRGENDTAAFDLVVARNESESFQILFRCDAGLEITSVDFTDLVCGSERIAASRLEYRFVEYVYMGENSWNQAPETLVRSGAGFYPDPLSNEKSFPVPANETHSIWVTLHVPMNAEPGLYKGTARVKTVGETYPVAISAEVNNVTVPGANESDFDIMIHQQIAGTWYYDATRGKHPQDVIVQLYGLERWTPKWWELVGNMADNMRRSRMNVLFVNTQQLLLDAPDTGLRNGKFTFDWSRFDEYIQFFIDKKAVNRLEGLHLGSTIGAVGETFKSYILMNDGKGKLCTSNVEAMSKPCRVFHNGFLGALYNHLKEKGWLEMWIQHIGDEAVSELQHRQYGYYMEKLKTQAPGMKCGDPTFNLESARNAVCQGATVVTPIEELYQTYKPAFDEMQQNGVRIYGYNCCGPGWGWLNRLVDKPVWNQRQLGWLCYKWGLSGWLHWGWNFWVEWFQQDFHSVDDAAFKGDHYSVYPDTKNNMIKTSIRMEAIRDMGEEYELLRILGRKNPELALRMVNSVTPDADRNYTRDTERMNDVRASLIRACAVYAGFD